MRGMNKRLLPLLALLLGVLLSIAPLSRSLASDDWGTVRPGTVVLFRHALAPGSGDPSGFKLNDCTTQRNLSDAGRAQAQRIGQAFMNRRIGVVAVWSSQWCRTRETADLAFPGQPVDQPAFNSFFGTPDAAPEQTRAAKALLAAWRGAGVLVVVTHQVNITALTGIVPGSGEGVVVKPAAEGLAVVGRLVP
jgi:phosphohistidine phosphatase SixA